MCSTLSDYCSLIDANKALIDDCSKIIIDHNKKSYKNITNIDTDPKIFLLKTDNTFNVIVIDFLNIMSAQLKSLRLLKKSIEEMEYNSDELIMHLNRSPSYIYDLEKLLKTQKSELEENYKRIDRNHALIIQSFCDNINPEELFIESSSIIEILFKMIHFDFSLTIMVRTILATLYAQNVINDKKSYEQIKNLTYELKQKCLGYNKNANQLEMNPTIMLQTFSLTPSTNNLSISQAIESLFKISSRAITIDNLNNKLRIISKEIGKKLAIVVIAKNNNDFYFDIDNLFNRERLQKLSTNGGISKDYIDAFSILQTNLITKRIKHEVHSYNYVNPDEIYLLWTNDMINFKVRDEPVSHEIIEKIIKGKSSAIVSLRNSKLEETILDKISGDSLVSFKQLKYLSFNVDNEERLFIDKLCSSISKYLKSQKSHISTEALIDIFQDEFKQFKPFHQAKKMPLQPLLIYTNAAIYLSNRIKRDMIDWKNTEGDISEIPQLVKIVIDSNDNIYTKFIASYYLATSSFK